MIAHAPSLVLICWALCALAGDALAPLWLLAIALAALLLARTLYRRYRDE